MNKKATNCYHWEEEDLLIAIQVQAGASKNKIGGIVKDNLKISITAQAENDKANSSLVKLLAKNFGVSQSSVIILTGNSNRYKRLRIQSPSKLPEGISRP